MDKILATVALPIIVFFDTTSTNVANFIVCATSGIVSNQSIKQNCLQQTKGADISPIASNELYSIPLVTNKPSIMSIEPSIIPIEIPIVQENKPPNIDCTGPDGKHLQITQQECDDFNRAWGYTSKNSQSQESSKKPSARALLAAAKLYGYQSKTKQQQLIDKKSNGTGSLDVALTKFALYFDQYPEYLADAEAEIYAIEHENGIPPSQTNTEYFGYSPPDTISTSGINILGNASSYRRMGNTIYGSDGSTYTLMGNTLYGNNGSVFKMMGNTIYGNDNSTFTRMGNTTYGNDGSTFTQMGNNIYGNDGSMYTQMGNTLYKY